MSKSDSPEGGQTSGGYKSASPSPASLEAWRSNVTPPTDVVDDLLALVDAAQTVRLIKLRDAAEAAGNWPLFERYEAELEALDEETPSCEEV